MSAAIEGIPARSPKRIVTEERKDRDREKDRERRRGDEERKRLSDARVVDEEKPSRTVRKVIAFNYFLNHVSSKFLGNGSG